MLNNINNESIFYTISELEENKQLEENNESNIIDLLNKYQLNNDEDRISKIINYNINYSIKDLYLICHYYDLLKSIKKQKYNKEIIIQIIVEFESNPENFLIVNKRLNLWFYINELKNDKFMKKYVLW